jgi:hypothetical protein
VLTLAATATPATTVYGLLFVVLTAITLGYLGSCWLWPFGACRRCHGTGKRRSPFGRAFGLCYRCDGTGRTLRLGRRFINALRDLHDKGSR